MLPSIKHVVDQIVTPAFALAANLLAQAEGAGATPPAPAAPQGNIFQQLLNNPLFPIVGVFFLFYFLYLAPEKRRKAAEASRMSEMSKNDRVITIGGIHGTVVSAAKDSDVVTLKLDDGGNTRIKFNRSAIATIVTEKKNDKSGEKD